MSALPPEADMPIVGINVCLVPIADIPNGPDETTAEQCAGAPHPRLVRGNALRAQPASNRSICFLASISAASLERNLRDTMREKIGRPGRVGAAMKRHEKASSQNATGEPCHQTVTSARVDSCPAATTHIVVSPIYPRCARSL